MNVTCPECRSMFRVDPSKVPSSGVRARCSVCGGVITIGAGTSIDEEFDGGKATSKDTPIRVPEVIEAHRPPTPSTPAVAHTPKAVEPPAVAAPAVPQTPVSQTAAAAETSVAVDAQAIEATSISPTPEPVATPAAPASTPVVHSPATTQTPSTPQAVGQRPPPFARAPLTPPASVPGVQRPAGSPSMLPPVPPARAPLAGRPSGVGPLAAVRPAANTATPPIGPSSPAFRSEATAAPAATGPAASRPASPARTPINPFLANDPNAKARRLSRALVSDLVTYFPQRRDEGLRDGNLKELFRDEIKKSYEEYVDQIGKEFADSTTHFQDALNEILAAGHKIF